jgi:hypothetical protein
VLERTLDDRQRHHERRTAESHVRLSMQPEGTATSAQSAEREVT